MPYKFLSGYPRGFALPTVIFLMVTVSAIMGYMFKLASMQSATVDLSLLASRADLATRSALEWATYEVKMNNVNNECPGAAPEINGFDINVSCSVTAYQEGSPTGQPNRFRYQLQIQAESAGGDRTTVDYAFRKLDATLMVEQ